MIIRPYPTEFDKIFESKLPVCETQKDAYLAAEIEFIKSHGRTMYANKESYRKARDRRLKRLLKSKKPR